VRVIPPLGGRVGGGLGDGGLLGVVECQACTTYFASSSMRDGLTIPPLSPVFPPAQCSLPLALTPSSPIRGRQTCS